MTLRKNAAVILLLAGIVASTLLIWSQLQDTEVWVTTTAEAFTGPNVGTPLIDHQGEKVVLQLHTTPAPWPEEAKRIWVAAKSGAIVHVTANTIGGPLTFTISGVSPSGHLKIECRSETDAMRISDALGIRRK